MYRYETGKEAVRPNIWPLPQGSWDESDNPFTIEGKIVPPQNTELKELLEILQQVSAQIARAIQLLNQIISNQ
ncbi:hypothetical protein L6250_01065 [Candidatus Parcubacteria bacterium]|nr:hypothetical protein [Patescibacteria group bacterium]MCG2688212.1 hypothetical protein [Candidatus Parcubacteria bacterium]